VIISPTLSAAERLTKARQLRAAAQEKWAKQVSEFDVWRPTPTQAENDETAASGLPVMIKLWDLSPINPNAFDPFEPPGRPLDPSVPPPVNTSPPQIVADVVEVGHMLIGPNGQWTGASTYARQWTADGVDIPTATGNNYTPVIADVGKMIGFVIVASNAGGSTTASAEEVGPVEPAP
jgi:hypothetical protein